MVLQRLGGRLSTTTTRRTTPPTPQTQPPAPLTIPQDLQEEEEGEEVILKLTIVYFGL